MHSQPQPHKVNGEYVGRAVNLSGALLPLHPVVCVPTGAELALVPPVAPHALPPAAAAAAVVPAERRVRVWDAANQKVRGEDVLDRITARCFADCDIDTALYRRFRTWIC